MPNWSINKSDVTEVSFASLADEIEAATAMSRDQLEFLIGRGQGSYAQQLVYRNSGGGGYEPPIWAISEYPRLLGAVSRFSNPQL